MPDSFLGKVQAIALRSTVKGAMIEVAGADAVADGGLTGDVPSRPERGITLLSSRQWQAVQRDLKANLPWHTRRANVLVEAGNLADLIGTTIRIGAVQVAVQAETRPCGLMDELHPGLRDALAPECRGGVYGRIVVGGRLQVGDSVRRTDA